MKRCKYVVLIILCPLFIFSQKVIVDGEFEVDSINVKFGLIKDVANPVSANDAATKAYVDANTGSPTYTVGLSPEQGGYIFWVSANGKHGLVAETIDQSSSSNWYEAQDFISNPSNHSADGANFRDWRMPTKYELNEMYGQKAAIGGFSSVNYWSSTEIESLNAWLQNFAGGLQFNLFKLNNYYVRSVRAF